MKFTPSPKEKARFWHEVCFEIKCMSTQPPPPTCPAPKEECNGVCTDLTTSTDCGTCGNACSTGKECQDGSCKCTDGKVEDTDGSCKDPPPTCTQRETLCEGSCVTLGSDQHCSQCGDACTNGMTCQGQGQSLDGSGTCRGCPDGYHPEGIFGICIVDAPTCGPLQAQCDDGCVYLGTDQDCDSCGDTCLGGSSCLNRQCTCPDGSNAPASGACGPVTPTCTAPEQLCGGSCVLVGTNENCQGCGDECQGGATCQDGRCACPTGQHLNSLSYCVDDAPTCAPEETRCFDNCVVLGSDDDCSACADRCTGGKSCNEGSCTCNSPQVPNEAGDCVDPTPSCELGTNEHCSACDDSCTGGKSCNEGSCTCNSPQVPNEAGDCVDPAPSCELGTNDHCSACDDTCGNGKTCQSSQCQCAGNQVEDPETGACIEVDACNNACDPRSGNFCDAASGTCVDLCTMDGNPCSENEVCNPVTLTCDCNSPTTRCDGQCRAPISFFEDNANCGGCTSEDEGVSCNTDSGEFCSNGECQCPSGESKCDGQCIDDEVFQTDNANCGGCSSAGRGDMCFGDLQCMSGSCSCPAGSEACGYSCFQPSSYDSDPNNCGSCGNQCSDSETCSSGTCQLRTDISATSTCGTKICGQALLGQGRYAAQYLAECANTYDASLAYKTFTSGSFFNCLNSCDNEFECTRMSFDHSKARNNCLFFAKTTQIDGSLTQTSNVDSVVVIRPGSSGTTYRGRGNNYDTATCPAPSPVTPATSLCQTSIQSDHGPNTCNYVVRCSIRYGGSVLATLPTSSYFGCLDICDKNLKCSALTWMQDSQTCTLFTGSNGYARQRNPAYSSSSANAYNWPGFWSAYYDGGCG